MKSSFAFLLVLAAITALSPVRIARAGSGITVNAVSAQVSFPSGVSFSLEAESAFAITDVVLLLNPVNQRYGAYTRNIRPDFQPSQRIATSWTWRRAGSSLPPGAEISYQWRMTDAAGQTLETQPVLVRVDDTRYQWHELREGMLTVRWYRGDERFGRELLRLATDAVQFTASEQGVDLATPVTIHVYGSASDMRGALPGLPGWVGGVSMGEWDMVLIPIPPDELEANRRALLHELTHQMIYQITFHPTLGSRVPAWLNEGLAVVSEGPVSRQNRLTLQQAVRTGSLPTLRALANGFSSLPGDQAQLHYAASESAVRFLLESEGPEKMRALLAEFRQGRTADDALRAVYGRGLDQTEDRWRISLGLRPLERGTGEQGTDAPAPALAPADDEGMSTRTLILIVSVVIGCGVLLTAGSLAGLVFFALRKRT